MTVRQIPRNPGTDATTGTDTMRMTGTQGEEMR